jgi:hypothetical protein
LVSRALVAAVVLVPVAVVVLAHVLDLLRERSVYWKQLAALAQHGE